MHRSSVSAAQAVYARFPVRKRTGFLTAYVFLRDNGWKFEADQTEIVTYILGLAGGSISEEQLAGWFEKNSTKHEE